MKGNRRVLTIILAALSVLCLAVGGVFWYWDTHDITASSGTDKSILTEESISGQPDVSNSEPVAEVKEDVSSDETAESEVNDLLEDMPEFDPGKIVVEEEFPNPYKDWFLKNPDMVGWIKIPDTCVDYPVMWTPNDEEYYLRKDFDKKYDKTGTPFLDTESSMYPASTNLIIYGHNFKDVMFYDVLKYEDEDYFKAHPYVYIYGKDYEHVYAVMAAFLTRVYYTTDTCFKYYKFFNAENEEEFLDFYNNVKELSYS